MNLKAFGYLASGLLISGSVLCACGGGSSSSSNTDGGASSGGSASGGSTSTSAASFADVKTLFQQQCVSCHSAASPGYVNLDNDSGLYSRLTSAISGAAVCNGSLLVDLATPSNSLLPKIVQANPPCGIRMPDLCTTNCLSATQIAVFQSWIDAGASQN